MHTGAILGRVSTKLVQRIVTFQIMDFRHFFSFSCSWDHVGAHILYYISSLKVRTKLSPQTSCILLGKVRTKVVKEIVKFKTLSDLNIFSIYWTFNIVVSDEIYS